MSWLFTPDAWLDPWPVHVGFLVDRVAHRQVLFRVLRFSSSRVIPPVFHSYCHLYTRCILNAGTNFRCEFPTPNKEKGHIDVCPQTPSFWGTAPTFTILQSFYSYTYGDTQNWYSAPIENEQTFDQRTSMPVKPFTTAPEPLKLCDSPWSDESMHSLIQVDILNICYGLWLDEQEDPKSY